MVHNTTMVTRIVYLCPSLVELFIIHLLLMTMVVNSIYYHSIHW